ncbi:MAG: PEP-CTERM sorting domain-containing protein [Gemmatimonadota bacterium]
MKRFGIIVFGLALLARPVQAQPSWTPEMAPWINAGSTVDYIFGGPSSMSTSGWGHWVGPYTAQMTGPTAPTFTVYCVDFYTLVAGGGRIITAEALSLGNPTAFPMAQRWGSRTYSSSVPLQNFAKAAYLASLFPQYVGNSSAIMSIQGAMWALTSGPGGYSSDPGVLQMLQLAEEGYGSYQNYDQWRLLRTTAVNGSEFGLSQHMLVQTQTVTPEPQTYVLLGSGLLFLVFVGRRRLKENGYS